MAEAELVVVRTFNNRQEADLANSALEAAGIAAFVRSDDAGGERPGMWPGRGVELIVRAEDAKAAGEVLDIPAKPA